MSSLSRHLSGRNILPEMLKIGSTGADEAGMQRYVRASIARVGYLSNASYLGFDILNLPQT